MAGTRWRNPFGIYNLVKLSEVYPNLLGSNNLLIDYAGHVSGIFIDFFPGSRGSILTENVLLHINHFAVCVLFNLYKQAIT